MAIDAGKKFPVIEIFGPTIQGEGPDQGLPVYFIRFGGCDFHCDWCDTPFAVLPELVRKNAKRMTSDEIVGEVSRLAPGPRMVVLSGGNPLLHDLTRLIGLLHRMELNVSVETQGTRRQEWLSNVERLIVSPKPPSSGHRVTVAHIKTFLTGCSVFRTFLKIVVFDHGDYEWAREVHKAVPGYKMYLSAGNDAGATVADPHRQDRRSQDQVVRDLLGSGRRLTNYVMTDPDMHDVAVQTQQHVLLWGNERGR